MNNQLIQVQHPMFDLKYSDPAPNFDRKKVYGKVFTLIKVKENRFIKPLESVAGGKLKQVVVDSAQTAKLLLKKRSFKNHVVFIPNDKIRPFELHPDVIRRAENIAMNHGGFAKVAYELI